MYRLAQYPVRPRSRHQAIVRTIASPDSVKRPIVRTIAPVRRSPDRAQEALEVRRRRGRLHAREMLGRVPVEVEVELRDSRLQDAPHRLPEVRHEPHQAQISKGSILDPAEVSLEQA